MFERAGLIEFDAKVASEEACWRPRSTQVERRRLLEAAMRSSARPTTSPKRPRPRGQVRRPAQGLADWKPQNTIAVDDESARS